MNRLLYSFDANMRQWTHSALVKVTTRRLSGAKQLPESILTFVAPFTNMV